MKAHVARGVFDPPRIDPRGPDPDNDDKKATGSMKMNGTDKAIAADLTGAVFPEAAAVPEVIACLPLAEGFSTSFRNFDVQKQKEKIMNLQVAGSDKVTVPGGTFDAFKVEITAAGGGGEARRRILQLYRHGHVHLAERSRRDR